MSDKYSLLILEIEKFSKNIQDEINQICEEYGLENSQITFIIQQQKALINSIKRNLFPIEIYYPKTESLRRIFLENLESCNRRKEVVNKVNDILVLSNEELPINIKSQSVYRFFVTACNLTINLLKADILFDYDSEINRLNNLLIDLKSIEEKTLKKLISEIDLLYLKLKDIPALSANFEKEKNKIMSMTISEAIVFKNDILTVIAKYKEELNKYELLQFKKEIYKSKSKRMQLFNAFINDYNE